MTRIINLGMNHETAPVELRECLAGDDISPSQILSEMRTSDYMEESIFLSTCNRVEALCTTDNIEKAEKTIISLMSRSAEMNENDIRSHIYTYTDDEAVKHIFRVSSSLDSMILGEPQILGQVKDAYRLAAVKEKSTGVILNRLMHKAFHVAKRVRTETNISSTAVSISYAAVELAKKIFFSLEGRTALLVGAGEMAELAAKHLVSHGVTKIIVANRSFDRAVNVAESFGGKPVFFEEIESQLLEADIVITSTASADYVVNYQLVKGITRKRKNRPLFFIDIAVPRDVEPKINRLDNIFLYDIDDLKDVVNENTVQRKHEAVIAERIIEEEVIKFSKWMKTLDVVPTIVSLQEKINDIIDSEVKRSLPSMGNLTPQQVSNIETLTASIAQKIINDPIIKLKRMSERSAKEIYLDITRKLFNLDQEKE